jgi:hypothetical protein
MIPIILMVFTVLTTTTINGGNMTITNTTTIAEEFQNLNERLSLIQAEINELAHLIMTNSMNTPFTTSGQGPGGQGSPLIPSQPQPIPIPQPQPLPPPQYGPFPFPLPPLQP